MASNRTQDSDDERPTRSVTEKDERHANENTRTTTAQESLDSAVSDFRNMHLRSRSPSPEDSPFSRRNLCRYGLDCFKFDCSFQHPPEWDPCEDGLDCIDFDCEAKHPKGRQRRCIDGHRCKRTRCKFLHPVFRSNACSAKDECRVWNCPKWHSKRRPTDCPFGEQCYNLTCKRLHPSERQLCPNGVECTELDCQLGHSLGRAISCDQGSDCDNYFCTSLHPANWDPCKEGSECKNPTCPCTNHPSDRNLRLEEKDNDTARSSLKSLRQRQAEREQAALPILAVKDQFCERLKNERILVVRAETGSGKSTQLPQYAAEFFGGLVVCTQPRVIAAISLARRVADEYDGTSVGHSVGYRVGHASVGKDKNRVPGTNILYMTDGTFIQESQNGSQLDDVRVLIIDEAHERSLNTDIVMGIAKELLETRPTDFYVVISSATIDTTKFLKFFQRTNAQPLEASGRVYPVNVEYIPKPKKSKVKESFEERVMSTILDLYDQHRGHILAFLPGQREIENAIELFERNKRNGNKTLDNCVAYPLYSSLSPEEQNLVLNFDEGENGENRMVIFCTNVAETSLTIKNVGLVIDCGLVNEGYFDYENRLNVVGPVRISRASAEQRKGRAGRTAPGHCVRLYKEDDLVLSDTTPRILLSSLDLVVLQLISLGLDPQVFAFMDPPDKKHIQSSLDLLKDLSCIDESYDINRKGELFAKLGIDPRYSAFLLAVYLEHMPILELAATIVAICIAPSSVFAITGETKEEKESGRDRISKNARKFESDLFYLLSVYRDWHDVGILVNEERTCLTCRKSYNRGYSCGPCRAAYSRTHLLNNKTLNYIESMSDELITTIKDSRWQLEPNSVSDANESEIIATNLFKYFPERHGCLVESTSSKEDARITQTHLCARISDTSTFYRRKANNIYFMAMSMAKLPGGTYAIDRLHPFPATSQPSTDEEPSDS